MKQNAALSLILLSVWLVCSCGSSPSEPDNPPSPSVLTVEFTGETNGLQRSIESSGSATGEGFSDGTGPLHPKDLCQVTAAWTICADANFASYALYRSPTADISENMSSAEVLVVYNDPNLRQYADNEVAWDSRYYYAVRTGNSEGEYSWSNEEEILTPPYGGGSGITIIAGLIQHPVSGHWYGLLSEAPWDESQSFCSSQGGNLVTINDQEENDWLLATFLPYLPEYNNFWTGFNDETVEGEWEWVSGEPVTYTNWAPGEPNNAGNEDYCWLIGVNYPEYKDWNDVSNEGLQPWGLPNGILELDGPALPDGFRQEF